MDVESRQVQQAIKTAQSALTSELTRPAPRQRLGEIDQTEIAYNVFQNLLETQGIREALYSLLRRTEYRFIAIFRFRGGSATSVVYVDRENLTIVQAGEVPETATYCGFARDGKGAFITADAMRDARTLGHVAREVVRAYCGLPLIDPDGSFIGTLCHYDLVPRDPDQLDPVLLLRAARALTRPGLIPPYPVSF